ELQKYHYRTMYMKMSEISDYLDDRIETFMKIVSEHHKVPMEDFGNPVSLSHSDIAVVGRIVSDEDGKLQKGTLALEPCAHIGGGERVRLDASALQEELLFPGQIVALKGRNSGGKLFKVNSRLPFPSLLHPASPRQEILRFSNYTAPLSLVVASGPYTTDTDLDFKPLQHIVQRSIQAMASAVILFGPFIDDSHPLVKRGEFPYLADNTNPPLESLFIDKISPILNDLPKHTPVFLVPHARDAVNVHISYPQDRFDRKLLQLKGSVKTLTNPCIVSLDGVVIAVNNIDVFNDIDSTRLKQHNDDIVSSIAREVFQQRCFYPVFPEGSGLIDVPFMGLSEFEETKPDLYINPSSMPPFEKVVEGVVCVNPGSVVNQNAYGHYSIVRVARLGNSDIAEDEGDMIAHKAEMRTRVERIS
ncbi:hypothetical protein CANCADRAFT_12693, partial [Tortispora caseinolytica NRRL Y-17796]